MTDKRSEREWIHGLLAVAASLLLLAAAPRRELFRGAVDLVGEALRYPEYPAVLIERTAREFAVWFVDRGELQDRMNSLRAENERLRLVWSMETAEGLRTELDGFAHFARITVREPLSWWSEVRINKGYKDGVVVGAPALQNGFLAGRVGSAEGRYAWVELLSSSTLMIPVVVEETRDLGVVAGDGEGGVWLLYIPENRVLRGGLHISTAMVSEALPPGIPLGVLSDERRETNDGYSAWRVLPGASLSQLYALEILHPSSSEGKEDP
ncbi:MAG: rod shape-determining protein MreC [Synergistaceae bacterium]|nr:rod shape-determining protein MreC [Synergistota bacterium]NLM71684.1 rod shape-determining protein MreC [Synergistaceae bacterium]